MNLEDIYNQLEKLENDLEYYINRLEEIKSLVMPQGTSFDKVLVDGRKHTDKILKYVEMEDKLQLEATIKYIKDKINHLNTLKEKEIERLAKYGEYVKVVVLLKEKEFIKEYNGKKRHLTWNEIADKVYCSRRTAINWYKLGIEERKRTL